MTEFRISIRPRLGAHLGHGLDRLAPLLATGMARRTEGSRAMLSNAPTPDAERMASNSPPLAPGPRNGMASDEQTASHALRHNAQDTPPVSRHPSDHTDVHAPHLRLVPTDPDPVPTARSAPPDTGGAQPRDRQTETEAIKAERGTEQGAARAIRTATERGAVVPSDRAEPTKSETYDTPPQSYNSAPTPPLKALVDAAISRRQTRHTAAFTPLGTTTVAERLAPDAPFRDPETDTGFRTHQQSATDHGAARVARNAAPHVRELLRPSKPDGAMAQNPRPLALAALDRAFPRAPDSPGLPQPDRDFATLMAPADLRAAILQLLEEDLLRHGLSPLGGR